MYGASSVNHKIEAGPKGSEIGVLELDNAIVLKEIYL